MDQDVAAMMRVVLESEGPIGCGPAYERPVPSETAKRFHCQSLISMVVHPKVGEPWVFGLHQCTHPRVWTEEEERLVQGIGRRIADALSSLLTLRDLQDSEQQYRDLVESCTYGVATHREGKLVYVNPATVQMLGYDSADEVVGKSVMSFVHPDSREAVASRMEAVLKAGKPAPPDEEKLVGKDGRVLDVEVTGTRMKHGGTPAIQAVFCDISERRRAEEALRSSEERFRVMFEQAAVGVAQIVSRTGAFMRINQRYCDIVGYAREEMEKRTFQEITHPDDLQADLDNMQLLLEGRIREYSREKRYCRKDGSIVWVNLTVSPMWQPGGEPSHHIAVVEDITERKQAEAAARRAQQDLLEHQRDETRRVQTELDRVRVQLVNQTRLATIGQVAASIAHELRNPLGAVRNAAYLLKHRSIRVEAEAGEYLGIIDREVGAADRIIRDLLEMSRAKEPTRRAVDLGATIREMVDRVHLPDGIGFRVELDPDPFVLEADPAQMQQVLGNLLDNAVQAMDGRGEIVVRAGRSTDCDTIVVYDSGPGVADEHQDRIFEPLFSTKAKGTGLGLTICRQIVERHGGAIDLAGHDGRGTPFLIRLPRPSPPPA